MDLTKLIELTNAINQLTAAFRQGGQRDWRTYTGILPQLGSAQSVLYNRTRDASAGLLSSILPGPFGQVLGQFGGRLAADVLIGPSVNSYGIPNTMLGSIPIPVGGARTSSAYQQMMINSALTYRNTMGLRSQLLLKKQFILNYYRTTLPGADLSRIKKLVLGATKNPITLPSAIRALIDPTNIARQALNAQAVGTAVATQIMRRNPFDISMTGRSTAAQEAVYLMSLLAASTQQRKSKFGGTKFSANDYNGFSAAAVSLIAKIIALSTLVMSGPLDINTAVQNFKQKVQGLTKALSPLRDIFGQDVRAMSGALLSITGQRFGAISQLQIRTIGSNITSAVRFSGVSPAQIAAYSDVAQKLGQRYGATDTLLVGLRAMGADVAAIASANAPMGTTQAAYSARVAQLFASAGSSRGADLAAMAYALAKNNNTEYKNMTFLLFTNKFMYSKDAMSDMLKAAGVDNVNLLYQAKGLRDYMKAKTTGLGGNLAMAQNYKELAMLAVQGAAYDVGASDKDVQTVVDFLQSKDSVNMLADIAANGVDPNKKYTYRDSSGNKVELSGEQLKLLQATQTDDRFRSTMTAYVTQAKLAQTKQKQKLLLQIFLKVDNTKQAGGLFGALKAGLYAGKLGITLLLRKKILALNAGFYATVGSIFGILGSRPLDIKAAAKRFSSALGEGLGFALKALRLGASGSAAADLKYQLAMKTLASADADSQRKRLARRYIADRMAFGADSKLAKFILSAKPGTDASISIAKARERYIGLLRSAGLDQSKINDAIKSYKQDIAVANILSVLDKDIGVKDEKARSKLAKTIGDIRLKYGDYVDQATLDKLTKGGPRIKLDDYQKITKSVYGLLTSILGILKRDLPKIIQLIMRMIAVSLNKTTR